MRQSEVDQGQQGGVSTSYKDRFKELERENRELKRANKILRTASAFFAQAGARPAAVAAQTEEIIRYIDDHRDQFGVEPICKVLPIAPSTYYQHKDFDRDPDKRSDRAKQDARFESEIERVWKENFEVYGVKKCMASDEP